MRIEIKGRQIQLNPTTVKLAKELIGNMIVDVNDLALRCNMPDLYITVLAVMNLMSQSSLEVMDEEKLEIVMNSIINQNSVSRID